MPYPTGDINQDGVVNSIDLSLLVSRWNTNDADADLNSDGTVDSLDLSTLVGNWGATGSGDNPLLVARESCIIFDPAYVSDATQALDLQQDTLTPLQNGVTYTTDPSFTAMSQWPGTGNEVVPVPGTSTEWNSKIGSEITLVALGRWDGSANVGARLISQGAGTGPGEQQYEIGVRSGGIYGLRSRINVGGTRLEVEGWPSSGQLNNNEAFVAAVTFDGSVSRLYIARSSNNWNIELVGSASGSGTIDSGSTAPVIGNVNGSWNSADNVWSGQIGMTGIWSRALSQQELQEIANNPIGSMGAGYEPPPAPGALSGLSVTSFTHSSASLTWNEVADATSYEVEVISGNTYTNISSMSHTVTGLSSQTSYSIRARAVNLSGNGPWSDAVAVTTAEAPAGTGPLVILDTDYAPDVDDCVALAQLHGHANLGEVEIIGTMLTASCDYSAGAIDAMNIWHGRPDTPVGAIQTNGLPDATNTCNIWLGNYAQPQYSNYPRNLGLRSTVTDSSAKYRELLSSRPDGSVDIVTIGFLNGIEQLLKTAGDGFDSRNGVGLVAAKVRRLTIMGGSTTNNHRSWNFYGNGTAAVTAAWEYVAANWPTTVPIHFCPSDGQNHSWGSTQWSLGSGIGVGVDAPNQPVNHIVRRALSDFGGKDNGDGIHLADPATVYYVARPDEFTVRRGTMTPTGSEGRTLWTDDQNGPHWCVDGYTANGGGTQALANQIEPLIWHPQQ